MSVGRRDNQGGVVCVGVDFGAGHCLDDVVDVEDEERGRERTALWYSVGDGSEVGLGVLSVCGLESTLEVRAEEGHGVWREVELMFEFVEEFGVGDGIVGFGEVDVDGEGWLSSVSEAMNSVEHCFQCHGQEELGLMGEMRLYFSRCFMSCLLMMVSKTLAMIGRRVS